MRCPVCGSNNREGELICPQCGTLSAVTERTTRPVRMPDEHLAHAWASSQTRVTTGQLLSISITVDCWQWQHALGRGRTILLGRYNKPEDSQQDAVDLVEAGGNEKGVSRRHALIKLEKSSIFLIDLESRNGTYLNGRRLRPHYHHLLNDGDLIRLGGLELRVQIT